MVCRLVEAEQRFGRHEHLGQCQTGFLASREDAHLLFDGIVVTKKEGAEQASLLGYRPLGRYGVDLLQNRVVLVHTLERVLSVVRDAHVGAKVTCARRGGFDSRNHLHEGRFAGTVRANERYVVATVELKVDVAVDVFVAVGLGDVLERDDHVAGSRRIGEVEVDVLVALGQDDELAFDLLDLTNALLCLSGLGGLVAELVYEHLHMGDVALLSGALGAHLFKVVLTLLEIGAVVARVGCDAAVFKGCHVVHAGIHKRSVVADDQHGALVARDKATQPLNALEVQVVGGLVEEQQIRMAQEQLGKRNAHLPAARELRTRAVEVVRVKAKTREDLLRVAFQLVAAQVFKAVLNVAVLFKQCINVAAGFGDLSNLELKLLSAFPHLGDLVRRGDDLFEDGGIACEVGFLLQVTYLGALGKLDGSAIGRVDAHDDFEHRGLARTVGANESVALSGVDLKGRTAE